ncbi:DUF418 domain-containing protein [Tsukamurella serpentis]
MSTIAAPTTARIAALDVARGIAILGTFGTNVWIFTDPAGILGYIDTVGAESWPIRLLQTLAQGKFLGLLSLMFGVGLAIQQASAMRRAAEAGQSGRRAWPGRYWRRAAVLFADGLLHYLLIAEFDVLMGYAVVSLIVSSLLILAPAARTRWIVGCLVLHLGLVAVVIVGLAGTPAGQPQPADQSNPFADDGFWDLVRLRIDEALLFRAEAIFIVPLTIALFLIGARLYQAGIFGETGGELRRRLITMGAVAAAADLTLGLAGEPLHVSGPAVFAGRYVLAPMVAAGLLALIAQVYLRRTPGRLGSALSRVGKTALSCYVLQNLIASVLCYGWGLGLAQRYGAEHRLVFTVAVYLLVVGCLIAASTAWTRRFSRGPIEMLMHRLA